jgi:1-acyl-sn-glycerol-3-phosphate acyltransferase
MQAARLRLLSLWVSQTNRVVADWMVRLLAVLECAGAGDVGQQSAWHQATGLYVAPFLLLAPLNGSLSNALPRRWVLVGAATLSLLVIALQSGFGFSWLLCLAVLGLAGAVYAPARYAMLPGAALDSDWPLPTVNGWIEAGSTTGIVAGILLGWWVQSADPGSLTLVVLLGLNLLCLLTAWPTTFPSDTRRPEPPVRAVAGFFKDVGRIARHRPAAGALLGLAGFQALVTACSGALVALSLDPGQSAGSLPEVLVLILVGAALGCGVAAWQGNPCRNPGLVIPGCAGLLLALGWAWLAAEPGRPLPWVPCLLLGFTGALVNAPLRAAWLAAVPADARGNAMSVMGAGIYALTVALAGLMVGLVHGRALPTPGAQLAFLAVLAALGLLGFIWYLSRNTLDLTLEILIWPFYDVQGHGAGLGQIPRDGPLLVLANHSAYLDPFWIGKMLPRRFIPMMTSIFFDKPALRWLMARIIRAIRVESGRFRREAPELGEAIRVLRAGGCVLIFPEGMVRRTEATLLRPFGQGVWHILRALPDTPVLVCWIEGGWGSYTSYLNGPPTRNKPLDWRRQIDIAFDIPTRVPPEVLADGRSTRVHLRRLCLACRRHLGLAGVDESSEPAGEIIPGEEGDLPAPLSLPAPEPPGPP